MTAQDYWEVRVLAELAGITAPEERLLPLAAGLEVSRYIAVALGAIDYGETEPACRFHAPREPVNG